MFTIKENVISLGDETITPVSWSDLKILTNPSEEERCSEEERSLKIESACKNVARTLEHFPTAWRLSYKIFFIESLFEIVRSTWIKKSSKKKVLEFLKDLAEKKFVANKKIAWMSPEEKKQLEEEIAFSESWQ